MTGNVNAKPATTAQKSVRLCQTVLRTDVGPVHSSGFIAKRERVKCLASHAVTRSRKLSVAYVVDRARNTTSQLSFHSSLHPAPSRPGPAAPYATDVNDARQREPMKVP